MMKIEKITQIMMMTDINMNLQENIRRILREESSIPLALRRRVSYDDIEEAFDDALERMAQSMTNPDSIIYKEKEYTTLRIFAKFVIDEMITYLEQDYFNDDNRVYFSDDDFYYDKIRKPLLKRYGKRIKEKYNEVKRGDINESILRKGRFLSRIEEDTKLEKEIKKVIDKLTKDDQFPENFYRFTVNSFIDNTFLTPKEINDGHIGNRTIIVTGLFKKPFSEEDSDEVGKVMKRIAPKIKAMFRPFYDEIRLHSTATIDSHLQSLDYFEEYPVYVPYRYK